MNEAETTTTPARIPTLWSTSPPDSIGLPGKMAAAEKIAAEHGLRYEVVIASVRQPEEFLGLPIPVKNRDGSMSVGYAVPAWAYRAADAPNGALVYLDIHGDRPPLPVYAAILRLVNEGVIGNFVLPPSVRFMVTASWAADLEQTGE